MIYALIDPETRLCRYVGKTKGRSCQRLKSHISDARRNTAVPRFRWINKLALSGKCPEVIDLEETTDNGWQEAEQFWIAYMRALGSPLLNATDGGDGIHGHKHSAETRAKQRVAAFRLLADEDLAKRRSESLKRAFSSPEVRIAVSERLKISHSRPEVRAKISEKAKAYASLPEVRQRMSERRKGVKMSDESKAKVGAANRGRVFTKEQRARMSAAQTGRKKSEESKQKLRDTLAAKKAQRGKE